MESLSPTIQTQTQPDASPKENNTPHSLRDKYTFICEIGHGTQGRIYLAERNADGVKVAIKQLNVESVKTWKAYDLFKREASVLQSLDIPGVAKFYEAIECLDDDPPCSYIVQEYIQGQSLAEMIKAGHRFALNRVYDIILQLLKILNQLQRHDPPIVHRDIKPSNILLKPLVGDDFEVYLIDFGAVANPQIQSGGSTVAGTFGYMAPEQMMGKPEPASDIYSLGAVAVHLISGRSPADMPVKDFHLIFEPEMQNMPPTLVAALRRMLDPSVENRLCDIDILSDIFIAFSNSIYSSSKHFVGESLSDDEYEARLRQVEYYGEDGNIALWQRLPDETPRKSLDAVIHPPMNIPVEKYDFPDAVAYREKEKLLKKRGLERDFWSQCTENIKGTLISIPFLGILGGVLFYALVMPALLILGAFLQFSDITVFGMRPMDFVEILFGRGQPIFIVILRIYGIGVVLVIIFYFYCFIKHMIREWNNKRTASHTAAELKKSLVEKKYDPIDLTVLLQNRLMAVDCDIETLLCNGRKTIATVVQLDYVTVAGKDIETQYSISNKKQLRCDFSCHGRPRFVISYKFNPPDDEREEDIIHKIVTYTDVYSHLHLGDPLPILYMIVPSSLRMRKGAGPQSASRERVVSMPFPYPLADPLLLSDIMYCDEAPHDKNVLRESEIAYFEKRKESGHENKKEDGMDASNELYMKDSLYQNIQNDISKIAEQHAQRNGETYRSVARRTHASPKSRKEIDNLFNELIHR